MKPSIVILSDLWGYTDQSWIYSYASMLKKHYKIQLFDCRKKAKIPSNIIDEKEIHEHMKAYGIQNCVHELVINQQCIDTILAFSIGGTIAWKAILEGFQTKKLYAISSTRLRYEKYIPNVKISLFYGESDLYKPTSDWFMSKNISPIIINKETHTLYQKQDCIKHISNHIIKNNLNRM